MMPRTAFAAVDIEEVNARWLELRWEQDGEIHTWTSDCEEDAPSPGIPIPYSRRKFFHAVGVGICSPGQRDTARKQLNPRSENRGFL